MLATKIRTVIAVSAIGAALASSGAASAATPGPTTPVAPSPTAQTAPMVEYTPLIGILALLIPWS